MKYGKIIILIMLSIVLISCGDDDNHNGFYKTSKYEIQENSCSGDFKAIENDEYHFFKIKKESFFGMPIDTMYKCENSDEKSCNSESGTWLSESSYSSGFKDSCNIGKTTYEIKSDSDGIKITKTQKSAKLTLKSGEECDTDLADKYESKLDCESIEIREANRL